MVEPGLRARCPAKVNLSLRVLGRRADGYHELDTVFQTVDLWDELEIASAPGLGLGLACDDPSVPTDGSNLVLRAASLLLAHTGVGSRGARLTLKKRIPAQGGLGGGSSDAAGTLRLCAAFWGLEVDPRALGEMARELGADVPFFLCGGTARGRGRGDLIEPLPPLPTRVLVLGCPPFGVSTKEVFERARAPGLRGGAGPGPVSPLADAPRSEEPINDLERVVYEGWPELLRFRDALLETGARAALLSGSGSTVYGTFDAEPALHRAIERLRPVFPGWRLIPTRTIEARADVSPRAV